VLDPLTCDHIYVRLNDVLTGTDRNADFAPMTEDEGTAILAILRDTLPDFPAPDCDTINRRIAIEPTDGCLDVGTLVIARNSDLMPGPWPHT
jgi:hypothetical protein